MHEEITLSREVEAIQIPSGDLISLPSGTKVMITQALGGTYTVATPHGLARIKAENADALGIDLEAEKNKRSAAQDAIAAGDLQGAIWEQLKLVYDPEIPVNIVDLGLVYDCRVEEEEGGANVEVKMTLTAPGCGMGPTIAADAQSKILMLDGIRDARVDIVWDPVWNQDMISEEGKMKLGMI
ncbi:MAG: putative Fe-S cluster assembly protein SufT [Verrucomicrobiae bacterium]|nr:putative Fe-S cluster assembly protein SufT [Verrucomicrobiae bacterium]